MVFYEKDENLNQETLEKIRASKSWREELEAIDYSQERIDVTKNEELKKILEKAGALLDLFSRQSIGNLIRNI